MTQNGGSQDVPQAAIDRSKAADLIVCILTFTDWAHRPQDEVEAVANRLLTQIEELRHG